jgi:hypothetical protein
MTEISLDNYFIDILSVTSSTAVTELVPLALRRLGESSANVL